MSLAYFPVLEAATGRLAALHMTPLRMRKFQARRVSLGDAQWLRDTINRESRRFGFRVRLDEEGGLALRPILAGSSAGPR